MSESNDQNLLTNSGPLICALIGLAPALWGYFYPHPYVVSMAVLMAFPWLALLIMAFLESGRGKFSYLIVFPSIVLPYRAFHDMELIARSHAILLSVEFAAVFLGIATLINPPLRRNWGWLIVLLPLMADTYGCGTVLQLNRLLDKAPEKRFKAQLIEQHRYYRWRNTSYRLTLGPWGQNERQTQEFVSSDTYYSLSGKSWACIDLAPGALGIEWYKIGPCTGANQ